MGIPIATFIPPRGEGKFQCPHCGSDKLVVRCDETNRYTFSVDDGRPDAITLLDCTTSFTNRSVFECEGCSKTSRIPFEIV